MTFELDKKNCLSKADKSKKGDIDLPIRKLCAIINASADFYTTSSCSGRTVLIAVPTSGKKNDSEWLLCSHDKINLDQVQASLASAGDEEIWFRSEPPIIHVCARTIDDASDLLQSVYSIGFKRSGIISAKNRIIVEIGATERIDCPIMKNGKILVDDNYLALLVKESNKKLSVGHNKIDKVSGVVEQMK